MAVSKTEGPSRSRSSRSAEKLKVEREPYASARLSQAARLVEEIAGLFIDEREAIRTATLAEHEHERLLKDSKRVLESIYDGLGELDLLRQALDPPK
jgi:hypothetical protein